MLLPDVPTMREQGFAIALREWYAFFMPAKASPDAVQRASAALQQAIAQPDVAEFGKQFGMEMQSSSPRQLADVLKADAAEWTGLAKETGFTSDSCRCRAGYGVRLASQSVVAGLRRSITCARRTRLPTIRASSPGNSITGQSARRTACSWLSGDRMARGSA